MALIIGPSGSGKTNGLLNLIQKKKKKNDKNKEALENYTELWDEIKDEIQPTKYEKDFMKIRFESDDNLPLGKILNILVDAIIVKSVFQENNKYYQQVHLHVCFYKHEYEYEYDSHCTV